MSRYYSYVNSAIKILTEYNGREPFSIFLKSFFSRNKKYGSRDRKQVSHLCYCYFRLGKALTELVIEERALIGLFLCSEIQNELLDIIKPEYGEKVGLNISEKLIFLDAQEAIDDIFPFKDDLSEGLSHGAFSESFFKQPDLFLRLRPGKEELVKQKLQEEGIEFEEILEDCISLENSVRVDQKIRLNEKAVVQDLNSQRVSSLFSFLESSKPNSVWDCCSGSGGKSIMAYDKIPDMNLTVTDVRDSILINLKKRFVDAGITNYKSSTIDLTYPNQKIPGSPFDFILADVPCSGSGTWGRTPEQLYYFDHLKIQGYSVLQRKIVSNLVSHLKPGGQLLYITCSVFRKENEENIEFFKKEYQLVEVKRELFTGYDKKADTMFASLLRREI